MKRKAIIFGVTGQDGYYLEKLLVKEDIKVVGVARTGSEVVGDIADFDFVHTLLKSHRPNYIFHLAANSTTRHSAMFENHQTISTGSLNILEATRLNCPDARIFLSGSAMQFKNEGMPISEKTPFDGSSPYSVARIQSVYAARYFRKYFDMKVYVGYFFNHDSPLRTEHHVNQKIVKAVQRISMGSPEKLEIGDIDVKKEFNFAGDIVNAVWRLVNQDLVFECIIGSGNAYSIKEWIVKCFDLVGRNWQDYILSKRDYVPEYRILVSDPKLLFSLGWKPEVDFDKLVSLMMTTK